MKALFSILLAIGLGVFTGSVFAEEMTVSYGVMVTDPVPQLSAGDTAWMLTSTMLVILMIIPGLALFYGGLARTKNMLSVLIQVFVVFALISLLWVLYGYTLVFSGEGAVIGDFGKVFLLGMTPDTLSATMKTVPEYVFVAFQGTFAAITAALIVGAFAERIRFAAVMLFMVLWFTFSYMPAERLFTSTRVSRLWSVRIWSGNGSVWARMRSCRIR